MQKAMATVKQEKWYIDYRIRACREPWRFDVIELQVTMVDQSDGRRYIIDPSVRAEPLDETALVQPLVTAYLHNEHAQILMDDLWRCGLRPTEGRGSAGALAATEAHLEDMRSIVFGMLELRESVKPK